MRRKRFHESGIGRIKSSGRISGIGGGAAFGHRRSGLLTDRGGVLIATLFAARADAVVG